MLELWLISLIIAAAALSGHNKAGSGFLLGLILGPLGAIIAIAWRFDLTNKQRSQEAAALLNAVHRSHGGQGADSGTDRRDCPYCAEPILMKARVCKHCGRDVEPVIPPTPQPVIGNTGHCPDCQYEGLAYNARTCPGCGIEFNAITGKRVMPK